MIEGSWINPSRLFLAPLQGCGSEQGHDVGSMRRRLSSWWMTEGPDMGCPWGVCLRIMPDPGLLHLDASRRSAAIASLSSLVK